VLVGYNSHPETHKDLMLIDFGLAVNYTREEELFREPRTESEHIEPGYCQADGNVFFASINCA
jgi:hypothetical protein